jgi:hypothetical protein
VSTVAAIRLARISPAYARECERDHAALPAGHRYGAPVGAKPDRYLKRSNICEGCHTTRALNGECLCW